MAELGSGSLCGVYPKVGDLVWMTKAVSYRYEFRPVWFRVLKVCPATVEGWVYLHGYDAEEEIRDEVAVFSCIAGMVIRRGV